jgi:hypothetical protein
MKIIVFGAGFVGNKLIERIDNGDYANLWYSEQIEIIAVIDNSPSAAVASKWGGVLSPSEIFAHSFDGIVIAVDVDATGNQAITNALTMYCQLLQLGVPENKILLHAMVSGYRQLRIGFINKLAEFLPDEGNVAEAGVFRGQFAGYINKTFPERKLYLFDTFTGFDETDIVQETELTQKWIEQHGQARFGLGNETITLLRCPYRDKVVVMKGYLPDTFSGLTDERFAFVNLDLDLYAPMLSALKFFYPRMVTGGVILCHDYYFDANPGVKKAVLEFAAETQATIVPINDEYSVAIV